MTHLLSNSHQADVSILKVDLLELTKQICLKDSELFNALSIAEINSFHWTKSSKKHKCPNLISSHKQFNKINLWVQNEILNDFKTSKNVKVLSRFIKLSNLLLKFNNFQSAYAVKAALDSAPIHRLETLWNGISKKKKLMWKKICFVFSVENNYKNLRSTIAERKPPLIPFIGVYLSDLTGLDAAHQKVDGVETEIRSTSMRKIYDCIVHYQTSHYDFKPHIGIQAYMQSMEYIEELEYNMVDSLFAISRELEPSYDLTGSSSSHASSTDLSHKTDNTSVHRQRCSPDLNHRGNYRVITEDERKEQMVIMPDSPTLTNDRHHNHLPSDPNAGTLKNIIDDSELPVQYDNEMNGYKKGLHHSKSTKSQASTTSSIFSFIPSSNMTSRYSSSNKMDIETKSYVQYHDPDILPANEELLMILTGIVKRKIKSRNVVRRYNPHVVLVKLFVNQWNCVINFYNSKTAKAKCVEDFREDYNTSISLLDANVRFNALINSPKLYIDLPHDTYVIQSIDDSHSNWPSIDKWHKVIADNVVKVKASKAAVRQNQQNLINFDGDFTRL